MMQLQFEHDLDYQLAAVDAVCDLFGVGNRLQLLPEQATSCVTTRVRSWHAAERTSKHWNPREGRFKRLAHVGRRRRP